MRLPGIERPRVLPGAIGFGAGSYGALALTFVQGILVLRILGPESYGAWSALLLILDYGQHYQLGTINSINRQIPLLEGQGRIADARDYADRGTALLLLLTLGFVPMAATASFVFYRGLLAGALALSVATILEVFIQLALTLLKTHSRFGSAGVLLLARAALNVALLPLVIRWGLSGAYGRIVIVAALALVLGIRLSPWWPRPRFAFGDFGEYFRDGFPLLAVGMVYGFQINSNRLLIATLLGQEQLGYYALAHIVLTLVVVVPGVVGVTSYPSMLRQFGATGTPAVLRSRVLRQTAVVATFAAFAATIGALLLPWFATRFLGEFVPGLPAALWLMPGIVMLSSSVPSSYFLQTIRHQRQHLVVSLSALALHVLGVIAVVRGGGGIREISMVSSASFALYALGLFASFLRASRD